jgi:dTDP-4-dehydrorhamnose reductase
MANTEPEKDLKNIKSFMQSIRNVHAKRFVLISTIEVYDNPLGVNEDSAINRDNLRPYGLHRLQLEEFIKENFEEHTIIRMPNLYGEHLKKNFVYDLIHHNRLDLTHKDNMQQWYNLEHIWKDVQIAITKNLSLVNFAVEPISCHELAKYTLGIDFTTVTDSPPRKYDMQSKYGKLFNSDTPYLCHKTNALKELKRFMTKEQSTL